MDQTPLPTQPAGPVKTWVPAARSQSGLIVVAALVGLGGGLASFVFFRLIQVFAALGGCLAPLGLWRFPLYGAVGGLVVGPMIYFWAREAKGHVAASSIPASISGP